MCLIIFGKYRMLNAANIDEFLEAFHELTGNTSGVTFQPQPESHIEFVKKSDNIVKLIDSGGGTFDFKHNIQTVQHGSSGGVTFKTHSKVDEGVLYLEMNSPNKFVVNVIYRFMSEGSNRLIVEVNMQKTPSSALASSSTPPSEKGLIEATITYEKID